MMNLTQKTLLTCADEDGKTKIFTQALAIVVFYVAAVFKWITNSKLSLYQFCAETFAFETNWINTL